MLVRNGCPETSYAAGILCAEAEDPQCEVIYEALCKFGRATARQLAPLVAEVYGRSRDWAFVLVCKRMSLLQRRGLARLTGATVGGCRQWEAC